MNTFYKIAILAGVATALISCAKEIEVSDPAAKTLNATVTAELPTKLTTSDALNYKWVAGDKIRLFSALLSGTKYSYPNTPSKVLTSEKGDGVFTGEIYDDAADHYCVVYPSGLVQATQSTGWFGTSKMQFLMATSALVTQTGLLSDLGNNVVCAAQDIEYKKEGTSISFSTELSRCFTSVIKLNVPESLGIKKLVLKTVDYAFIKGTDGHKRFTQICGKMLFGFDGTNNSNASGNGLDSLTVIRNGGADTISGDVYIAILTNSRSEGLTYSRVNKFKIGLYTTDLAFPAKEIYKDLGVHEKLNESQGTEEPLTVDDACMFYGLVGGTVNDFGTIPADILN